MFSLGMFAIPYLFTPWLIITYALCHRKSYNTVLSLKGCDWTVDSLEQLGDGVQPQISIEELLLCEDIIRNDERVIQLAKAVGQSYTVADTASGY